MNPLMDVLNGKSPERVPVLIPTGSIGVHHSGLSPREIRRDGKSLGEAQVKFQRRVGGDATSVYYDANYIPEAFGCRIKFTRFGPVISETLSLNDDLNPDFSVDSCQEILKAVGHAVEISDRPVMALFEGPFTTATRLFEADRLLVALYRMEDRVRKIMETITETLIEFSSMIIEQGADIIYIPDPSSTPDMISPSHAVKFSFPHLRRLIGHIRKRIPVMVHMCGDTEKIWDLMPILGGNAYSLDQKISLRKAREKMKNSVLGGNVDPVNSLLFGDEKKVREDCVRSIEEGGPEKFILMPGCGVPPETPVDNLRVMVEVARGWTF